MLFYASFISQILSQIKELSYQFNHWWMLKPNSLLQKYLLEHQIILEKYFNADTLCNTLYQLFQSKKIEQPNNKDIVILDNSLQLCFQTFMIYKPHLFETCKHLIQRAPGDIETKLRNDSIYQNLSVNCSPDLIYQDPSSIFHLNPQVRKLMETHQHIFKWSELIGLLQDFCTTHPEHFSRQLEIIKVKKNSPWATLLPFKYFHIDQCGAILKSITLYLGRNPFVTYSCSNLQKRLFPNSMFNEVLKFVEDKIDETIVPPFLPSIHI